MLIEIIEIIEIIGIIGTFILLYNTWKNRLKIRFIPHHDEYREVLKSNLWLRDNSIRIKISWDNGNSVIYGASKNGYFSYLPGNLYTGYYSEKKLLNFFADKLRDESIKDQYKMQTKKQCKKFIKKMFKETKVEYKNR